MSKTKCIGVLTSGGDSPGMNAAIRAVVRTALNKGIKAVGVKRGYDGLIHGDIVDMDVRSVADIMHRGGTVLHTGRSAEFMTLEGRERAVAAARIFEMDGLVVIGGDGSFKGARELSRMGLPTIGIPGTIDNDIGCTDYTIGFDTAINTALDAINKLRDTAASHERCSIIEVMGRNSGYIALHCGIAGGAEFIVIPEKPYKTEDITKAIIEGKNRGKAKYIIVVAEGMGGSVELAKTLEAQTGIESRATILGHIQRGGTPSAMDRVVASIMGAKAVELLADGKGNRIIALKDNKYVDYDIEEALKKKKSIDEYMFKLAKVLAI